VSAPAAAAPSGVVTFLFTDVEGSTRRWETDADVMRKALAAHDEVLRAAVEAHGGWLFKHTGDGVCAAFASPTGAVDGRYEPAATIAGFALSPLSRGAFPEITTTITHLREVLGDQTYESLARKGETMTTAAMVTYAYDQIDQARTELEHPS
jgi:class 3 adenylate cyclase